MNVWVIVVAHGMDLGGFDDPSNEGRTAWVQEVVGFFMTEDAARSHAEMIWHGGANAVDILKVTEPLLPEAFTLLRH